eukprot:1495862-Amphidinium_carterae.2
MEQLETRNIPRLAMDVITLYGHEHPGQSKSHNGHGSSSMQRTRQSCCDTVQQIGTVSVESVPAATRHSHQLKTGGCRR